MAYEKTYWQLLLSPLWQKRRLEVLEKHDYTCEDCGSKEKTLHVHHCMYEKGKMPWEYGDDILMCLCHECHDERQSLERDAKLEFVRHLRSLTGDELHKFINKVMIHDYSH